MIWILAAQLILLAVSLARCWVGLVWRIGPKWVRRPVALLGVWGPPAFGALCLAQACYVAVTEGVHWLFPDFAMTSPTTVGIAVFALASYLVASVVYGIRAIRKKSLDDRRPIARTWPLLRPILLTAAQMACLAISLVVYDSQIQRRMRALQAEALTLAVATAPAPVPDEENAALCYERLEEHRSMIERWSESLDEAGTPAWSDQDRDDLIREATPLVGLFEEAVSRTGIRLDRPWTPNIFARHDSDDLILKALCLLGRRAILKAERGEFARSDVELLRAVGSQVNRDPRSIGRFVANSAARAETECIEAALAGDSLTMDDLRDSLADAPTKNRANFDSVLNWTHAETTKAMADFYLGELVGPKSAIPRAPPEAVAFGTALIRVPWAHDDILANESTVAVWRDFIAAHRGANAHVFGMALWDRRQRRKGFSGLLRFNFYIMYMVSVASDTEFQVSRTAVACTIYKRIHGRFPNAMADLVPDIIPAPIVDPYDGSPVRIRSLGNGLVVFPAEQDKWYVRENWEERATDINKACYLGEARDLAREAARTAPRYGRPPRQTRLVELYRDHPAAARPIDEPPFGPTFRE